jgi:hypothetical protein
MRRVFLPLIALILVACFAPVDAPPPPTSIFSATPQLAVPTSTVASATFANPTPATFTAVPGNSNTGFCQDAQTLQLLDDLKSAIQSRDGELLASLVNPTSGVGVRFIRSGNVITYFDNIKFIFETTYQADWGLGVGSGEPVKGSFHDIVLPSLDLVFASNPIITCNELKVGGATYVPEWPYSGMDYYSVHYPGTDQYAGMDWETWAVGIVRQEGKPMLAALVHYAWEP